MPTKTKPKLEEFHLPIHWNATKKDVAGIELILRQLADKDDIDRFVSVKDVILQAPMSRRYLECKGTPETYSGIFKVPVKRDLLGRLVQDDIPKIPEELQGKIRQYPIIAPQYNPKKKYKQFITF